MPLRVTVLVEVASVVGLLFHVRVVSPQGWVAPAQPTTAVLLPPQLRY